MLSLQLVYQQAGMQIPIKMYPNLACFQTALKAQAIACKVYSAFTADGTNTLSFANLLANDDGWIFAVHVQCQDKRNNPCSAVDGETSHHIAGPEISPIPIPGAIWLFGTALSGIYKHE